MKKIFGFLVLTLVLVACGGNKDGRPLQDYVSAFLNGNETIVAFGKVDLNTILDKTEYKKIPKLGVAIDIEVQDFKRSLKLETPVFFAVEGPMDEDGTPKTTYAFFEVTNADSLVGKLKHQGFDMNKEGDIDYFESGDVCLGVRNNLAILITKKGEFDGKLMLTDAFDKTTNDVSEGKIDELLAAKGDVVLGMSVANLYKTSNTDLSKLSEDKQAELTEMVNDSYVQTAMSFEKGKVVIETKNLFSDGLKKKLFFKNDVSAGVVKKLGTGSPTLGFAMNLDMKKMQAFIDEYAPTAMSEIGEMLGGEFQMALAMGGKDGLSGLLSGEVGMVMVGNSNPNEGMSDFNIYVGIGKNGQMFASGAKSMLEIGMAQVDLDAKGIAAYSNANFVPQAGKRLNVPKGCEIFGKKGVTAFINLEGVDLSSFEFEEEAKIIYLVKYVTFEMDENGSKIVIQAKDGKENMLKQAMDVMIEEFSGKIGNMAI
ncbi:MAG: hypothetical protein RI922_445 [Bacteroidota bacterium]|jgi:hypothetical protein